MREGARVTGAALAAVVLAACGGDSTGPSGGPPILSSLSPAEGTVGTEVRILGSDFRDPGLNVFFGDLPSPRVLREGDDLFALAPEGLVAGTTYDVHVVNDGGAADTLQASFQAVAPRALRVNGVSRPTGLRGMTVIIEGSAFGDSLELAQGKVFFRGTDGSAVQAAVLDPSGDWADGFIVTSVPQETADTSAVWVETATGSSDSIEFGIIQSGVFSPSLINWTSTTSLPQALQGLGGVFVPIEDGASPANWVFTVGGADATNTATTAVYRAAVAQTGALEGSWTAMTPLPEPRAYHTAAAATSYTAALDTTTTGGALYAIGGVDEAGATKANVWFARVGLDGQVGAWQPTTALPAPLHSAGASLFRGFLYVTGGADATNAAVSTVYRAKVNEDGSLGAWEALASLPGPTAYHSMVGFGPYLYTVGGDAGTATPAGATQTGTEINAVRLARVNVRDGSLMTGGWAATESLAKARSKHSAVLGGGALFTTSGVYAGNPGSSENTYAELRSDGTVSSWQGATGSEIIAAEIGVSLYNQAAVTFVGADGRGHVLVLGGADRSVEGQASDRVVFY